MPSKYTPIDTSNVKVFLIELERGYIHKNVFSCADFYRGIRWKCFLDGLSLTHGYDSKIHDISIMAFLQMTTLNIALNHIRH